MAVNEQDIETIERYLDDALDMAEVEALRARLTGDGDLVAALERIRAQRTVRKAVFAGYEPEDAAVARVAQFSSNLVKRRQRGERWRGGMRYVAAAAACVALGFFGRGLIDSRDPAPGSGGHMVAEGGHVNVEKVASYKVTLRDESGRVVAVQRFDSIEKAQEFAADLARWQSHSERLASGRFVLTADRF